jgi:RinA family phage transcriptional activator
VINWKASDNDYKFIENEVRLFPLYQMQLEEAIQNIILATPQRDENGGGRSNIPGRPVEHTVMNLFDDNRIMRLRRTVNAVNTALDELDEEKRHFIIRTFWKPGNKNMQGICIELNITTATYYRWKKAFLLRVGLMTGDYRGRDIFR